jgi:hypothetical protein
MKKTRYILLALALTAAASFPGAALAKSPAPCKTGSMFDGKIASMFDGGNLY